MSAAAAEPLSEAETLALPVFPLPNAVLLPGSPMALHLFEPRYRALARACLGDGPMAMAIALLVPDHATDAQGRPRIARVAGAGRIVAHHARPEGTFDILLVGVDRVTLEEFETDEPFRRARATRIVDPEPTPALARELDALARLASQIPAPARPLPLPPPEIVGTPARRLDLLADRYFPTEEGGTRRAVLEAVRLEERVRILREALSLRVLASTRRGGAAN